MRRRRFLPAAVVGHRGEAAGAAHAHPRAHCLEVAPGEDAGMVLPERGRRGAATVELVAVGRDDQAMAGKRAPTKDDQADTKRSTRRCTPMRAPSRSRTASNAFSSFT